MSLSFPKAFLDSLHGLPGYEEIGFVNAHQENPPVSIRLNPLKGKDLYSSLPRVAWCNEGRYLNERPLFYNDPLWHAGAYYVQEASSMFISHIWKSVISDSVPNPKWLDVCASPGGKSTLLASQLQGYGLLISNEAISSRVGPLIENISKWGYANTIVTQNDPKSFARLPAYFDALLVDAPCSGSGLFRKDDDAVKEWSLDNVKICHSRQQRILFDVLPSLKNGGYLVYCTCSYSKAENEEICDWLIDEMQMEPIKVPIESQWGIVESHTSKGAFGYRFYPHLVKGEGFFAAVFRKPSGNFAGPKPTKNKLQFLLPKEYRPLLKWIGLEDGFEFMKYNDEITLVPNWLSYESGLLFENLNIRKFCLPLGKMVRNDLIPDHCLAMSYLLSDIVKKELNLEQALNYLRRDEIDSDTSHSGWVLLTYKNVGLGWAKYMDGRVNNYYPKSFRLHKRD